jgi:tetratricopeptide (TPR) repeat protein
MSRLSSTLRLPLAALAFAAAVAAPVAVVAQQGPGQGQGRGSEALRQAQQLDREGRFDEARSLFQSVIDDAREPAELAAAQRRMAMHYGFMGDCANAVAYEEMVISYWVGREDEEPQNAFYQEGEMANEGARVCVDSGDLDTAERMYRRGYMLGNMEPEPRTHPKSLWDFRLAHALGRISARRGDADEARRQVALARAALDSDPAMAEQQERFYPYLAGYVHLYLGELDQAERLFDELLTMRGNQGDPFMHSLVGMLYERQGRDADAREMYRKASELVRAHNPPAAFAARFLRGKLGGM